MNRGGIAWRLRCCAVLCCRLSPLAAQAPVPDNSGNHLLNGTYYFRQVIYGISTSVDSIGIAGDISEAVSIYGNISFDGNGNYVISGGTGGGNVYDSGVGSAIPLSCYLANSNCTSGNPVSGTYSISASGLGYLSTPLGSALGGDLVYGLVSATGIFVGSSSETQSSYADMFIAAPLTTPAPTNASFQGAYTVAGFLLAPGNSARLFE